MATTKIQLQSGVATANTPKLQLVGSFNEPTTPEECSGEHVITVSELPTENIDEGAIYKVANQYYQNIEGVWEELIYEKDIPVPTTEEITVTPTKETQEITPKNADYISKATVNPIPDKYVIPSGTANLNTNGEHDVSGKAKAVVDVPTVIDIFELPTENIDAESIYRKTIFADIIMVNSSVVYPYDYVWVDGFVNYYYVPTKPTDNVQVSDPLNGTCHWYYVEDENTAFWYRSDDNGGYEWISIGEQLTPYHGVINDISQITSDGYYVLLTTSYHKYIDGSWCNYIQPYGTLEITENGTYPVTDKAEVDVNVAGSSPKPQEIATEEEMTALLDTAEVGSVYQYVGETTDTYENGAYYVVEETVSGFTVSLFNNSSYACNYGIDEEVAENSMEYGTITLEGVNEYVYLTTTEEGFEVNSTTDCTYTIDGKTMKVYPTSNSAHIEFWIVD